MKKQRLPHGWTEKQICELAARHDNMTEEEQVAEIDELLARITDENIHGEWDTGPVVGKEIW